MFYKNAIFTFSREAVEHFLTALVQQSQACISKRIGDAAGAGDGAAGGEPRSPAQNVQQMSETIWSTLRLALSYLNRTDLHPACMTKNLDLLKQEFKIE